MIIKYNNIYSCLIPENDYERSIADSRYRLHKISAPGINFISSHLLYKRTKGKQGWDGLVRFMSKDYKFLTGKLPSIYNDLYKNKNLKFIFKDERNIKIPQTKPYTIPLRDYQMEALNKASQNKFLNGWWPRGVLKLATGAGKTEIAIALCEYLSTPSLYLVHKKTLINQTRQRFKSYGIDVGQLGDGVHNINPQGITVATIQTLSSFQRRGKKEELEFLKTIKQVFFDECHLIAATLTKGNEFVKLSTLLESAYARWGLTATPFMKDEYSNWLLEGVTGNVLYEIKNDFLIKKGYLTRPIVHIYPVSKIKKLPRKWSEAYDSGIILNTERNKLIIKILKETPKPCMILTDRVAHAEIIQMQALKQKIYLPILHYKHKTSEREKILGEIKEDKGQIVCTKIFDEGLDFPELQSIILAGGGKSTIKQLQRIGRVLRRDPNKPIAHVYDFKDSSGVLARHSKEREKIWKAEKFQIVYE